MDPVLTIAVHVIAGVAGGILSGIVVRRAAMGRLRSALSGAAGGFVGGVAAETIPLVTLPFPEPYVAALAGFIGGLVMSIVVGLIMHAMDGR